MIIAAGAKEEASNNFSIQRKAKQPETNGTTLKQQQSKESEIKDARTYEAAAGLNEQ